MPFMVVYHLEGIMGLPAGQISLWLFRSTLWLAAITVVGTWVPLWLGVRSLSNRDF
jgi:hypothetical protein